MYLWDDVGLCGEPGAGGDGYYRGVEGDRAAGGEDRGAEEEG